LLLIEVISRLDEQENARQRCSEEVRPAQSEGRDAGQEQAKRHSESEGEQDDESSNLSPKLKRNRSRVDASIFCCVIPVSRDILPANFPDEDPSEDEQDFCEV